MAAVDRCATRNQVRAASTKGCRASLDWDSPFDFAQGRLGVAVPTGACRHTKIPHGAKNAPFGMTT